ncbi:MAG: hypothetical protein JNM10_02900 [Planctomycetia bacterium]|nr:hypothetical protein [Planctomycetia bacterium]
MDVWHVAVPDARVAWVPDEPGGDRSAPANVATGPDGRFRLEVRGPADAGLRGVVHATRGTGGGAIESYAVAIGERTREVGNLMLDPAQPVDVEVRRDGRPVPGARVLLWRWAGGMYRGGPVFVGSHVTGADGRATFPALTHGYVLVWAVAPDGAVGRVNRKVAVGDRAARLRVDVRPTRSVEVRVVDDATPPRPVAGAVVGHRLGFAIEDVVHSFDARLGPIAAPTSADGTTRLSGVPDPAWNRVRLIARAPGHAPASVECKPDDAVVTVVLPGPTRIPVEDGEVPRPASGTKVAVRPSKRAIAAVEGWVRDGALVVPLAAKDVAEGFVFAPDGSSAALRGGKPISFRRPRTVEVRVVEAGVTGLAGVRVSLAAKPYVEGPWDAPVPTDADGRVTFHGLPAMAFDVYAFPTTDRPHGVRMATADLSGADRTRGLVVGPQRELVARVAIDGRSAIPERLWWQVEHAVVLEAVVDRAAATLRLRLRSSPDLLGDPVLTVGGDLVRSTTVRAPWPEPGGVGTVDVALAGTPEIVAEVRSDPDDDGDVFVERWCGWHTESPWLADHGAWPHLVGRTRLRLDPGRYRLHDVTTGLLSAPFDVPTGAARIEVVLDRTGLSTVKGRIELPDGVGADDVGLVIEGEGIDTRAAFGIPYRGWDGLPYAPPGFAARVPKGKPVRLYVHHRQLQPAREGGEVTVVGPRDDVVLKLGPGATLVTTLLDPEGKPLPDDALGSVYVVATRTAPASDAWPIQRRAELVTGRPGTVAAAGLPFGTVDVWVMTDAFGRRGFAVLHAGRVVVAEERVELGERRLSTGSRIIVRAAGAKAGKGAPEKLEGMATAQFGPREPVLPTETDTDGVGEFRHLAAGRWFVSIDRTVDPMSPDGRVSVRDVEVEVDGVHDVVLDVDYAAPR